MAGVIDDDGESPKANVLDFSVETWFNILTYEEILLFSYV